MIRDKFLDFGEWYRGLAKLPLSELSFQKAKLFENSPYSESVLFARDWQERWELKTAAWQIGHGWYSADWFTVFEIYKSSPEAEQRAFTMPNPQEMDVWKQVWKRKGYGHAHNPPMVVLRQRSAQSSWLGLIKATPWANGGFWLIRYDRNKKQWLLTEEEGCLQVVLPGLGSGIFMRAAQVVESGIRPKLEETVMMLQWIWAVEG